MRPEECAKLDSCFKVKMIGDKDILDFQYAEAVREVCANCSEGELIRAMIYAIDIDGTLCDTEDSDYKNSTPRNDVITKVNQLYDRGNTIKIFTGRGATSGIDWREFTENQLKTWGVKYHELIMGKPKADIFIDDKAVSTKDWIQ